MTRSPSTIEINLPARFLQLTLTRLHNPRRFPPVAADRSSLAPRAELSRFLEPPRLAGRSVITNGAISVVADVAAVHKAALEFDPGGSRNYFEKSISAASCRAEEEGRGERRSAADGPFPFVLTNRANYVSPAGPPRTGNETPRVPIRVHTQEYMHTTSTGAQDTYGYVRNVLYPPAERDFVLQVETQLD